VNSELAIKAVISEYERATSLHPRLHSPHEAYAVILEELDELKAEVWKRHGLRDKQNMQMEAIQVAAMAIRFLVDVTP